MRPLNFWLQQSIPDKLRKAGSLLRIDFPGPCHSSRTSPSGASSTRGRNISKEKRSTQSVITAMSAQTQPTPPSNHPPGPAPGNDPSPSDIDAHKSAIRASVWSRLRHVARPDSRFDADFSSFIADFAGSGAAARRLTALPEYRDARAVFVAPDNCLEGLRAQALLDGKRVLVTTYGIRRGFVLLEPERVREDGRGVWYAATLDGMEGVGRKVGLEEMRAEGWRVDLLVTGTGAVSARGVRFGKGHGFFDLEWGMLYSVGVVRMEACVVGVVHDCQVVEEGQGEDRGVLRPDIFDTVCDVVVTPTRTIRVEGAKKPWVGILWDRLAEGMEESIPPLRELKEMQRREGKTRMVGPRMW